MSWLYRIQQQLLISESWLTTEDASVVSTSTKNNRTTCCLWWHKFSNISKQFYLFFYVSTFYSRIVSLISMSATQFLLLSHQKCMCFHQAYHQNFWSFKACLNQTIKSYGLLNCCVVAGKQEAWGRCRPTTCFYFTNNKTLQEWKIPCTMGKVCSW